MKFKHAHISVCLFGIEFDERVPSALLLPLLLLLLYGEKLFHSLLFFLVGACAHHMHCDLVILLAAIISSFAYVLLCINTCTHTHTLESYTHSARREKKGDASHATTSTSFDRIMEFYMAKLTSRTDFDEQINMKLRHHPGKHIRNALMRCQCQRWHHSAEPFIYFFLLSHSRRCYCCCCCGWCFILYLFFSAVILLLIIRLILSWKCCHNIMAYERSI